MKKLLVVLSLTALLSSTAIAGSPQKRLSGVAVTRDVAFATVQSGDSETGFRDLKLDVYAPKDEADTARPAVVIVHGGFFTRTDKSYKFHVRAANYFAQRGFVAISIDHRQVHDFPEVPEGYDSSEFLAAQYAAVMDAKAAVRWLRANAATYGVDKDRVVGLGSATGATCLLGVALTDNYDFTVAYPEDPTFELNNPDESAALQACVALWGNGDQYLNDVDAGDPPLLIVHGANDQKKRMKFKAALRLEDKLYETGARYEFYPLEQEGHVHWKAEVEGQKMLDLAYGFLTAYVGAPNT